MTTRKISNINWHRTILMMILCLFGLSVVFSAKPRRQRAGAKKEDPRVYLEHADELEYDIYGSRPDVQIARGKVKFRHKGGILTCDSAYFNEQSNSFEAFGNVFMKQGDTLTLKSEWAWYDGNDERAQARRNVVLTHRKSKLYCDSLDYDRMYGIAYFFDGGKLIDKGSTLTSDWGQYNTETRDAVFYYKVRLKNNNMTMYSDTLYYDTRTSVAHIVGDYTSDKNEVGPSMIVNQGNVVYTTDGYYDTNTETSMLYGRSTVDNEDKTITADSLFSDSKKKIDEGFGRVIYIDKKNKNRFEGNHVYYDENMGYGYATDSAVVMDFSQKDTLYVHADSLKLYTYNINTDSVYRVMHGFHKVRAYRTDIQAVCDSLVFNSKDSCLTLYKDPIAWNMGRQVLGEVMHAYMQDSTIRYADVIGQAMSIERMDSAHYNQLAAKEMQVYFNEGKARETWAIGNVQAVYYPIDDADTTIIGLNFLETDTMKMYLSPERKLEKIWASKSTGTMYPITQIPPDKLRLPAFAWFDYIRPKNKDDIFYWRGKGKENELKQEKRREAPKRKLE